MYLCSASEARLCIYGYQYGIQRQVLTSNNIFYNIFSNPLVRLSGIYADLIKLCESYILFSSIYSQNSKIHVNTTDHREWIGTLEHVSANGLLIS